MTKINLVEMNELALSIQSIQYKEDIAKEMGRKKERKIAVNSNESAKREMAVELMMQGFSEEAISRILNISPDQLPESLPF